MLRSFDAIAFDIDGTLYPAWKLNFRLIPFCVFHPRFMLAFRKTRKSFHNQASKQDFFYEQAKIMTSLLVKPFKTSDLDTKEKLIAKMEEKIDKLLYKGWIKPYSKVKLYKGVVEVLKKCNELEIPVGILSDFLPGEKLKNWNIDTYIKASVGAEDTGALKPSAIPFLALAKQLQISPNRILYVGNNYKLDCLGGKNAGLKTALIVKSKKDFPKADFTFKTYDELYQYLFKED